MHGELTRREREVGALLAAGCTNKEIGVELVIEPSSVKGHVSAILKKLGAGNRTAAAMALRAQRPQAPR